MVSAILDCKIVVPPLLEGQLSPPYHTMKRLLDHLQKWREYFFWLVRDDDSKVKPEVVQSKVDELIKTVILIHLVHQYDPTAVPTFRELVHQCSSDRSVNDTSLENMHVNILRSVFEPVDNVLLYRNEFDKLAAISETIGLLNIFQLPTSIIGDFHQLCLDIPVADIDMRKEQGCRRTKGVYYTPAPLVDYLVYHTLGDAFEGKTIEQIAETKILDPSCGCGTFLIAAMRYILELIKEDPSHLGDLTGILKSTLYATDIDDTAVLWARKLILLTVWQYIQYLGLNRNGDEATLKKNIICHNFLEVERGTFNDAAYDFDVIVGGPPFVRVHEMCQADPEELERYRSRFKTASGQCDLHMLFMEKAIEMLRPNGMLAMSVSNSFLRSNSGLRIRELIAEKCAVREIVEFDDNNVYPDAQVRIALIRAQRTQERIAAKYVGVSDSRNLRRILTLDTRTTCIRVTGLSGEECRGGAWVFNSQGEGDFLDKIESLGSPLSQLPIKVSFGVSTGADSVFCLTQVREYTETTVAAKRKSLDQVIEIEKEILVPMVRGRNIKGYAHPKYETMCICPYDAEGRSIPEGILRSHYPKAYEYLQAFQNELSQRNLRAGSPWYSLRNGIGRMDASPKIISSAVSSGRDFTLIDDPHMLCNGSCVVIQTAEGGICPYYVIGILNSSVFDKWAKLRMPSPGTGWIAYRLNILREFPLICEGNAATDIGLLVRRLLLVPILDNGARQMLLDQIDECVRLRYAGCN